MKKNSAGLWRSIFLIQVFYTIENFPVLDVFRKICGPIDRKISGWKIGEDFRSTVGRLPRTKIKSRNLAGGLEKKTNRSIDPSFGKIFLLKFFMFQWQLTFKFFVDAMFFVLFSPHFHENSLVNFFHIQKFSKWQEINICRIFG